MVRRSRFVALAMAAVVVLAGCNKITRVTSSIAQDASRCFNQSISGDGQWVVFTTLSDPSGQTQPQKTILRNLGSGASVQVAGDPSVSPSHTAVSDNGTRVVLTLYARTASGSEPNVQLWTKTSGKRTRISPAGESALSPAISGNGRKVTYATDQGRKLWIYDVGTGQRKAIARPSGIASGIVALTGDLSDDGRYVVVTAGERMWVVDTTAGTVQGISAFGLSLDSNVAPSISGDGRWVVFGASPAAAQTKSNVYLFDRTTGRTVGITNEAVGVYAGQPSISGDGAKIAYTTFDRGTGRSALWIRDRASGATSQAVADGHPLHGPTLSRDGRRAAFCSQSNTLVLGSPLAPNLYTWGS